MSEPRLTDLALYLRRLGFGAPPAPTLETLRQLQLRHTGVFPFENLTTLSGEPVLIDLPSVEKKVLHEGRGGYCYELNNLYLALLQSLGFEARGISGRVVMGQPEGAWTARTHRLSLVTLDGVRYISDVGFGGMVPTAPLLLDIADEQLTPHESHRTARRWLHPERQGRGRMASDVHLRPAAPGRHRLRRRQLVCLDSPRINVRQAIDGGADRGGVATYAQQRQFCDSSPGA